MAIQLARRLTGLTVIATASRPETIEWCSALGAHHVINHHQDFAAQLAACEVNYCAQRQLGMYVAKRVFELR
jgi:NADPH2:quinone reductase